MKKYFVLASLVAAGISQAQFISEIHMNPPGTDQGMEFLELQSAPGFDYTGYFFLTIDGDGTNSGQVDVSQTLTGFLAGTNGLLLIRDDAGVLSPAPDPATNVQIFNWTPDIENGSNTLLLCQGTAPAVGTDFDTDNDGVLDSALPFTVIDAIGVTEDDGAANYPFSGQLGFQVVPVTPDLDGGNYTSDSLIRVLDSTGTMTNGWVAMDTLGSFPGPFQADPTEFTYIGSASPAPTFSDITELTPGVRNVAWSGSTSATVSGTITLGDFVGTVAGRTVLIEIFSADSSTLEETLTATLDASGNYSVTTTVAAGTHDVYVTGTHWLRKFNDDVAFGPSATVSTSLTNGDIDGDNEVGPGDFSSLSLGFGSSLGDSNYTDAADLDGDEEVGPSDFTILSQAFGTSGD